MTSTVTRESSQDRRWVPVSALPLDLIVELRGSSTMELRRHVQSYGELDFGWVLPIGAGAVTFGALHATFLNALPFSDPARYVPLLGGALLLGLWGSWRQIASYKLPSGQGLLVGPTSLVIVDRAAVEVLPAEKLTLLNGVLSFQGKVVHTERTRDHGWEKLIEDAIARAADPDARAADRWRRAATQGPSGRGASRWSSLLLALGVTVGAAVFFEALPLLGRGASTSAGRLDQLRTSFEHVQAAAMQQTSARDAATHAAAAAAAQGGTIQDAQAFLDNSHYTDESERAAARSHLGDLITAELRATGVHTVDEVINRDERFLNLCGQYNLPDGLRLAVVEEFRKQVELSLRLAKTRDDLRQYVADLNTYDLDAEFRQMVVKGFLGLLAHDLAHLPADDNEVEELQSMLADARSLAAPPELTSKIQGRLRSRAMAALDRAHDADTLDNAIVSFASVDVGDDWQAAAQARYHALVYNASTPKALTDLIQLSGAYAFDFNETDVAHAQVRYEQLMFADATSKGSVEARAYLMSEAFNDDERREKVVTRLKALCGRHGGKTVMNKLFVELCAQDQPTLAYELDGGTGESQGAGAAQNVVDVTMQMGKDFGLPFEAGIYRGPIAMVHIDVTAKAPAEDYLSYPCTVKLTLADEQGDPIANQTQTYNTTCKGKLAD